MKVPPGACDCHVHVFGPVARFPLAPERTYTPPDASIDEPLKLQRQLGFERVVIVQPSVYGADNACTLDAPLGWHVQTFTTVSTLKKARELPVPLVIDHFGLPKTQDDVEYLCSF